MRKGVLMSLFFAGILFVMGCSGSDSGGSGSSSKAKITANNATDVTNSAFQATNSVAKSSGTISDELDRSGGEKLSNPGKNVIAGFGGGLLAFLSESGALEEIEGKAWPDAKSKISIDDFSGKVEGLYGGSAAYTVSIQGNSFRISVAFDEYTSRAEEYLDGTVIFTGHLNSQNNAIEGSINISFDGLRLRYSNDYDSILSGNMVMDGDKQKAVFTANISISDQLTGIKTSVNNYVLDIMTEALSVTYKVAGDFHHSKYGSVTVSTEEAFVQQLFADHPKDGSMLIEGGEGTKSRLTIIDSSSYMIEADLNGDGSFEWKSGTLYWIY